MRLINYILLERKFYALLTKYSLTLDNSDLKKKSVFNRKWFEEATQRISMRKKEEKTSNMKNRFE